MALGFTYSTGFMDGAVASRAAAAQAAFSPSVSITSPRNGSVTVNRNAVVSGRIHDANGVKSLTVNGRAVKVSAAGRWSATVHLHKGANSISALASNVFGNTGRAHVTVTYRPLAVSSFTQSHGRWREGGSPGKRKPPIGTSFAFTLSGPASVELSFTRTVAGRRVAGRCVAQTRGNRHNPGCQRTVTEGSLSLGGHAGRNTVASFTGHIDRRTLAPGKYTVVLTAMAGGTRTAPRRLTFTIVS